jgi:HEAT repeat protein
MMKKTMLVAAMSVMASSLLAAEPAQPFGFEGAKWIWFSAEPMPMTQSFPGGANYFRGTFALPEKMQVKSAEVICAADNLYTLYINGKLAGESGPDPNAWHAGKRFDVADMLVPGRNVIALEAINTVAGPAGLIVKLAAQLDDGKRVVFVSDEPWKSLDKELPNWQQPKLDDQKWRAAHVVGDFGIRPWGRVTAKPPTLKASAPMDDARRQTRDRIAHLKVAAVRGGAPPPKPVVEVVPPADYPWPEAVAYLGDDCSLYRPSKHSGTSADSLSVTIFNPRNSRAFPEHDLPAPMKVGRKLFVLKPARPGVKPQVLLDAGKGGIGSPSVSFDGRWIYVSMAREGEAFFHIYKVPAAGGEPQRLTDGPFHDIDPAELPDGRIVFVSTRIGTFEEYHNPPSRALFAMKTDGSDVRPLTNTIIFDNEPEVMADGRILFIRSDNFFDRGKVETLLHAVHPDGTEGYTEFGLDNGPEYGGRLRAFNVGSPAPLPDGRVAFLSSAGIDIGRPGCEAKQLQHIGIEAGDVAALPDGRLLCTVARRIPVEKVIKKQKKIVNDFSYEKLAILDPAAGEKVVVMFNSEEAPLHSPVFLGARPRPPVLAQKMEPAEHDNPRPTGVLFCQNARYTKNSTAGWPHVRAIRVIAGKGLTVRSSHSYIVHAGNETTELGTVPLAPDGSFAVEVPADTPIAFQAVDGEGRSELNEMSWVYVRPGERRGCVGCHQTRQVSPPHNVAEMQAMRTPPLRLMGQSQSLRFRGNNPAVTGMMELQLDRFREIAGINRHSIVAEPNATGAQEVAALVAQLRGTDERQKVTAAQRLAIFRDPAAAPSLAELLRDTQREVRVAAATALSACGTRESVEPLLAALADPNPLVAQSASVALENLTGHAESFNAFVSNDERMREVAKWRDWFRANNWDQIEQELVKRMESADRNVVRRAAVALGHIGRNAARTALRKFVVADRGNNPYPEWRKSHLGDGAKFNSLEAANPRTLQAATRALGWLKDDEAVPMLAETLSTHSRPATGNLFLAEAAAEALGRIATPAAEAALTNTFARLEDYTLFTYWYGDHPALMACHASPVHYLIIEALDAMGTSRAGGIVTHMIRSVPTDFDRALFPYNDDCETLYGRVIRRSGLETAVVETCLSILGDAQAQRTKEIEDAIGKTIGAWGGKPDPENRAAQILSLVCRDRKYEPRVRAVFEAYRAKPNDIPRLFDTGIPVIQKLPSKHWVCFFTARLLGNLADPRSVDTLIASLDREPPESAPGYPDPLGPGVLFLHNDLTPCWRAAAAWALGRIGDTRATPTLLKVIGDMKNALDTRNAAAEAMERLAKAANAIAIRKLAADYPEVSTRRTLMRISDSLAQ